MKRKETIYKGLQFIDVYYTDNTLTSPDFFQITEFPTQLTAGKNLIKLKGNPVNLSVNSYLNVEILDFNGDPIYYEIVNYIDEDRSRVISIYIYSETSPGDCTVTILGEAINVPTEWQGKGNVKWSRTVSVNPTISNTSEIIFETLPTVNITEQIGPHLDRTYNIGQFPTYNSGYVRYFSYNGQPAIELSGSGASFTDNMKSGTITVTSPINPLPNPTYTIASQIYTSTIKKILTPTTALLNDEYVVYSSQSIFPHIYNSFEPSSYSISYETQPTYTVTENSESYALIQISDLQPATGDVSRIKIFSNNNGTVGTWEPISDIELQETEIFVASTSSLYPEQSIGIFTQQSDIDTYWSGVTYLGTVISSDPVLTFTNSSLMNSVSVTGAVNISGENDVMILRTNSAYKGRFYKDSSYKVRFNAVGVKSTNSNNQNPKIQVYLSGSAFNYNTQNPINSALPITLGKLVGEKEITSTSQRLDDVIFSFEADNDGDAVLQFVIHSGEWNFSDIHVTTDNDAGYTPTYTRIKALTPTAHKIGNQLTFKIEYYNVAGVKSKQQNIVANLDWQGGNRYIDGNYSMLTGSLYVADSLESGVAISGYPNSGFIRSLGYDGFNAGNPGFLLWSGSAMPASTTTYQGVGLELYADTNNYFRYRTNPSELIVKTQKFFFGATSPANFISGSNGNLEISSSAFHLSPNGNVTASAFIAVSGSIKLFDSNNRFVDANNVGRVVYFDQTEKTFDVSTITSVATAQTASVFQTFILPGETEMQMAFTWRHINSDINGNSIQYRVYIQSASLTTTDGSAYGTFSTPRLMLSGISDQICNTSAASTSSGFYSDGITSVTDILADHQGKYIQVYMIVYSPSSTPAGEFKMKNFVFRTSRILGNAVNDTQYQAIPESMSNSY